MSQFAVLSNEMEKWVERFYQDNDASVIGRRYLVKGKRRDE